MIGVKTRARNGGYARLAAVALAIAALGCSKSTPGEENADAALSGSQTAESPPAPPKPTPQLDTQELAASHILIQYQGSARAPAEITRSQDEALELARSVAQEAKAPGADFAALAREHSEGPSAPNGGDLGVFPAAQMIPEFSAAVQAMDVGGVSDPVETAFGYHVIRRNQVLKASARHILVMYAGSMRADGTITRSKAEALARAQDALARVRAGEDFAALAREYSDGPSSGQGGDLGEFNKGVMTPEFDAATFACKVGKVTDIVETPFGYHIIQRYK